MLVMTRKRGESIMVGDGIEIQVISVGRHGVRIGIAAPRDIPVHRREVYELVMAANRSAASADAGRVSAFASSLRNRASAPPVTAAALPVPSPAAPAPPAETNAATCGLA